MQIIERSGCYVYQLDRIKGIREKNTFETEIAKGLSVVFGRRPDGGLQEYKLVEIAFSKEAYTKNEAARIWSSYGFRYYTKNDLDRDIPVCRKIREVRDGEYIAVVIRNTGKKMPLKDQVVKNRMRKTVRRNPSP